MRCLRERVGESTQIVQDHACPTQMWESVFSDHEFWWLNSGLLSLCIKHFYPSHNYWPPQKKVLLRDTWRKVANQSERLEKSKCMSWATRKMKSKVVKKLSWVSSTLCSCKPTIQMYEDSNLSLTSVQRGAKQTSKQKVTFVTIESREFFGSSEWLDRESCSL